MKVGVIMGGVSAEREVSLQTGNEMLQHLDKKKYDAVPIVIDKREEIIDKTKEIDVALLALHGAFGEDGSIQGILEALKIPYTGCGVLSSAICMDKDISKKLMRDAGIKIAKWLIIKSLDEVDYIEINKIGYPMVVKPNSGGSSVATAIVRSRADLLKAIEEALKYDKEVMLEEFIKGEEITCPILNGKVFPILAIKPKADFFDYTSKYTDNEAEEYTIELDKELQEKIEKISLDCYNLFKCEVYARLDLIIKDGEPYVLEMNTLPGMTRNSLFPKSAASVGISFGELLNLIIEHSLIK